MLKRLSHLAALVLSILTKIPDENRHFEGHPRHFLSLPQSHTIFFFLFSIKKQAVPPLTSILVTKSDCPMDIFKHPISLVLLRKATSMTLDSEAFPK